MSQQGDGEFTLSGPNPCNKLGSKYLGAILTYQYSVQNMIDRVSKTPLSIAAITAGMSLSNEPALNEDHWSVVYDICEGVRANTWEALSAAHRIDRLCEIVALWPCYSTSGHLYLFYKEVAHEDPNAAEHLWQKIIECLRHLGTPLAEAVEYVLWVDFFEDQSTCEEAWHGLLRHTNDRQVRDRILINAGPVPYALKKPIYHQMIKLPNEHETLAESLAHSKQDYFGDIDRKDARKLLRKLDLPRSDVFFTYLKENL